MSTTTKRISHPSVLSYQAKQPSRRRSLRTRIFTIINYGKYIAGSSRRITQLLLPHRENISCKFIAQRQDREGGQREADRGGRQRDEDRGGRQRDEDRGRRTREQDRRTRTRKEVTGMRTEEQDRKLRIRGEGHEGRTQL